MDKILLMPIEIFGFQCVVREGSPDRKDSSKFINELLRKVNMCIVYNNFKPCKIIELYKFYLCTPQ
jgi:hypothetical protein